MANENKIPEIIRSSMENIRSLVDANTVIGNPIVTSADITIIPISKVTVGIASGGIDYNPKKEAQPRPQNFGGGGGTGLSVSPVGFLIVDPSGAVDFINVTEKGSPDPIDQVADIVERVPDIIGRIKDLFTSGKDNDIDEDF
ncbi:MAG: sporulation protein YtfJ [Ruminococcaceae bacterium]|nr:sporulation protein YtfJ [Oscillospiraceae bacterium]